MKRVALPLTLAIATALAGTASAERVDFDELIVLIEINATDGDVGFHSLVDVDAWRHLRVEAPDGRKILNIKAFDEIRLQGLTENFFESAEPLCSPSEDEEDEDELVVPLAEFLSRFAAGEYDFRAAMESGDVARETAELTYNLPAAPDVEATEDMVFPEGDVVIMWEPGDDLGDSCHDQSLIDDGTIPDPSDVEVVAWEVALEADDEDAPARTFNVQVPADQLSVTVPADFMEQFLDLGFSEFKFEVGAIEESGNRTFSEGTFEIE